jgi:hypothetical protein
MLLPSSKSPHYTQSTNHTLSTSAISRAAPDLANNVGLEERPGKQIVPAQAGGLFVDAAAAKISDAH